MSLVIPGGRNPVALFHRAGCNYARCPESGFMLRTAHHMILLHLLLNCQGYNLSYGCHSRTETFFHRVRSADCMGD